MNNSSRPLGYWRQSGGLAGRWRAGAAAAAGLVVSREVEMTEPRDEGERVVRRREAHGVATPPVYGLRPGQQGSGDEILILDSDALVWVAENTRPELAAATWQLQRRILERRGRTKRGGNSCRCMGCLSPNCGFCKGPPTCQGTGERMRCRNRWCERTRVVNGKEIPGRGKLLREREGALPPSRPDPDLYLRQKVCVGLCYADLGESEQQSPCPQVEWGKLWYGRQCSCGQEALGDGIMHAEHRRQCEEVRAEGGEREWQNEQITRLRNMIESDASIITCVFAQCNVKLMGVREYYKHLIHEHWGDLPNGERLLAAAHMTLWKALRMEEEADEELRAKYQAQFPMMPYVTP